MCVVVGVLGMMMVIGDDADGGGGVEWCAADAAGLRYDAQSTRH